ncbi:MAG: PEGA domain-containing protein [Deltaproteobacteria bacterium]|nr:PEGA domain-containing protein [Deltaproteobacteria bacterium]
MANPGAIPTLAVAPLTTYPHQALGVDSTLAVPKPPSRGAVLAVLGAVTLLTFVLALASRACSPGVVPASPLDGRPLDALVSIDAPVPVDAPAVEPIDAAFQPTIPPDAPGPATTLLEVQTRPEGASIKVGDQMRRSPARFALPAGHHTVIAELPGYEPERREVDLLATEHLTQEIQFTKKIVVNRPVPVTMGRLTIRTTPYSEVFTGGRKIGEAPFADLVMLAGSYTLTFKNPTRPTTTKRVTITAGKTTKLSFALPL